MKAPAAADLQRWSEDVARDSSSLAFIPLARAYRKQGRRDAALKLCLRGLEHHPHNVDAHALLAMLYFESGRRPLAYDEWSIVLRLEPEHFEALRGMGFFHLEQGDDNAALRNLQRAAQLRPKDTPVQEALKLINDKRRPEAPDLMPWEVHDPWADTSTTETAPAHTAPAAPAAPYTPPPAPVHSVPVPLEPAFAQATVDVTGPTPAGMQLPGDPARLFEPILRGGQLLGALLVDARGLVLAGSLAGAPAARAQTLGAILGGSIEEAARTTALLALGTWQGILLDAEQALLHLSPVREGAILLLAAHRDAPPGWMLRSAQHAATLADRFLEEQA